MFHVGFTGTSSLETVTKRRLIELEHRFRALERAVGKCTLHHGDCIGADQYAHDIAAKLGWSVEIHPPKDEKKRAWCSDFDVGIGDGSKMHKPKAYLERNKKIVESSRLLFALPSNPGDEEFLDDPKHNRRLGGTWATVRYAKRTNFVGEIIIV